MDQPTPEAQLGDLAARALDDLHGRPIIGAVLIVVRDDREERGEGAYQLAHWTPEGQHWITTQGVVEDWRQHHLAENVARQLDNDE
ncbi:MAG: hypothetical protein PGN13_16150 [Patulibacter minatonensis]